MRTFLRLICLSGLALLASCGGEKTPDDFEVWGLDVSRHQRNVNWEQVVEHERPDFVLIKATEGTMIVDPTYDRHRKELEKAGVPWGAYHFFGHRTPGKQQARNFIRTAKLDKGNIIPVLDIEKLRFMTDPKKSVREAKAFCDEIERYYGTPPIIYCSTNFYETYLKKDFEEDDYILWIADYRKCPPLRWQIWQHTDSHSIRGIRGNVDRNVFRGSREQFRKLIL
ncbi:glycoside hydrolase family 25 protein [uncultured Alistipes sp.]|uniref:glycoside hydrolase family 25 protein n=1 Tax=uncultured Alistipes sp. TaxID=538949 RepID=UPI002626D95F|nr:glycoside hydrolase family 25 protein [uncultured Alistipes sp.]